MKNFRSALIAFLIVSISFVLFSTLTFGLANVTDAGPGCNQDIWNCTEWSACLPNGTQTRICTLEKTCPDADNDKPLEVGLCDYATPLSSSLNCTTPDTIKKRIDCRLDLNYDSSSDKISYMPEECRSLYDSSEKDFCIGLYSKAQSCSQENVNSAVCLKDFLSLNDINKRHSSCKDASCTQALSNDVYSYAKIQIFNLELRSEQMRQKGLITKQQSADIIFTLEQDILRFNNLPGKQDKLDAINAARNSWKEFISSLKEAEK